MVNKKILNKEFLCINLSKNKFHDNYFSDSKHTLISNISEIKDILKNDKKLIYTLYFYAEKVEKILYDNEEIIEIKKDMINKDNISEYFYLSLLIGNNTSIINYSYDIDLIMELENELKKGNKNIIRQIIISKIGIDLINNYKNTENYNESENDVLISKENEFLEIIKNNIFIFKELNLDYTVDEIKTKKIDSIYIDIIINLIRQKKFENYDTINILKQLDLEYIPLTKPMFNDLNNVLTKNEFLTNYQINKANDLNDPKIIYFYYFLLKYILKDPIYIYQIEFLAKARLSIIDIIKSNQNPKINKKMKHIIEND